MKKTIGKPENWQDFESLCKKLWGEIWSIPNTIKKNGRLGQNQSGIDIYGIPKGEKSFWGIQCKGKDEYTNAKLTEKEILEEIAKAHNFKPQLSVYVIATTANKDSRIEEFIRLKSIENQSNKSFEILLFCWEDIVDLLEENPTILHSYLHGIGAKGKFDFKVSFNDFQETLILTPTFEKQITKTNYVEKSKDEFFRSRFSSLPIQKIDIHSILFPNRINKSWCDFDLVLENIGSSVIEDWHFIIKFKRGIRAVYDEPFKILPSTTFVDDNGKSITYYPKQDKPLIQKDNRYFKISVLPNRKTFKVTAEWELKARDFNLSGTIEMDIKPNYIESEKIEEVNDLEFLRPDKVRISDYVVEGD
jgi:hypothetical protein